LSHRVQKFVINETWLAKAPHHGSAGGSSVADFGCGVFGSPGCGPGFAGSFGAVAGIAGARTAAAPWGGGPGGSGGGGPTGEGGPDRCGSGGRITSVADLKIGGKPPPRA
jgi:hypothetical protein